MNIPPPLTATMINAPSPSRSPGVDGRYRSGRPLAGRHRRVLEVEDLAVTFTTAGKKEFPALRGVSLTLHAGEILG
jgi:ABC-type uncharacterized transport system ATPase subunit